MPNKSLYLPAYKCEVRKTYVTEGGLAVELLGANDNGHISCRILGSKDVVNFNPSTLFAPYNENDHKDKREVGIEEIYSFLPEIFEDSYVLSLIQIRNKVQEFRGQNVPLSKLRKIVESTPDVFKVHDDIYSYKKYVDLTPEVALMTLPKTSKQILEFLREGEAAVDELAKKSGNSERTIERRIKVMEDLSLVEKTHKNKHIVYRMCIDLKSE